MRKINVIIFKSIHLSTFWNQKDRLELTRYNLSRHINLSQVFDNLSLSQFLLYCDEIDVLIYSIIYAELAIKEKTIKFSTFKKKESDHNI